MRLAVFATIAVLSMVALDASGADQYGPSAWRSLKALYENGEICLTGPCDLAAGTTVGGAPIGGGGVSDGDKGDVTVSGSGATWTVDSGAVAFSELSGTATDSQIPDTITASNYQLIATDLTRLIDNCDLENDGTPIPDSCVGDGTDGGGGGNSVEVSLALSGGAGFFSTTVTGQAWVALGSEIVCTPLGTTADGLTPEAIAVADLKLSVSDRVAATGFNLNVYSPNGLEGTIRAHCIGV